MSKGKERMNDEEATEYAARPRVFEAFGGNINAMASETFAGKGLSEPVKEIKVGARTRWRMRSDTNEHPQDKWNLVPAFLRIKGLVKQHLDSFNYFVEHEMWDIVRGEHHLAHPEPWW